VVLAILTGGAGLSLVPGPLYDSPPEVWEMGLLIPEGPNLFTMALCAGDRATIPLAGEGYRLLDPSSTDPRIGQLSLSEDATRLHFSTEMPGQVILSFGVGAMEEGGALEMVQTVRVYLRVGLCTAPGETADPVAQEFLDRSMAGMPPISGYLFPGGEPETQQLLACQGQRYSYLFTAPAGVRNTASSDPAVATLVHYAPSGRLMVYATGTGNATLHLEVDELDFPVNDERWQPMTLQVSAIDCSAASTDEGDNEEGEDQGADNEEAQGSPDGNHEGQQVGGQSAAAGTSQVIGVSVSGGGSVTISQTMSGNSPGSGDGQDGASGTASAGTTSFTTRVQLSPGDSSSIFVGVSNGGTGDIGGKLDMYGSRGITVTAEASGDIVGLVQTCTYCWRFTLPAGPTEAGTGVTLNIAVDEDEDPDSYTVADINLETQNL